MVNNGDDYLKKCMEIRVKGRRPVGKPRKTLVDDVVADISRNRNGQRRRPCQDEMET